MNVRAPHTWGITSQLVLVATVPSFVMFLVVGSALYLSGRADAEGAIRERGSLIATAFAATIQLAVAAENIPYLERAASRLVAENGAVVAIELQDADRKVLVHQGLPAANGSEIFEAPISVDVPDINVFGTGNEPHVSMAEQPPATFRRGRTSGYVLVTMSSTPALQIMKRRLAWGAGIVAMAMLSSAAMGLYLAQQIRIPLQLILNALRAIRQGLYDVRLDPNGQGELGELQSVIGQMAKALGRRRAKLENLVDTRTRELRLAVEAAQVADAEKRRLIARGNELIEEERHRIAAEIHDHLNASLIVMRMKVQTILKLSRARESTEVQEGILRLAQEIYGNLDELYASARQLVKQLRPEVIDTVGLKGAIEEMVRNYDQLSLNCSFSFHAVPEFPTVRGALAMTGYRLVQEALSNVVKHAEASMAIVRLGCGNSPVELLITIEDDGRGFDSRMNSHEGIGLIGMRERLSAAGGALEIRSGEFEGTLVTIHLPLQATT